MATFNSTTFGSISGKHGTAVAAAGKNGKNVLRVYTAPRNPNSEKQQIQRAKFGMVNRELAPLRDILKIGYKRTDAAQIASSFVLKNAVIGEYPDFTIDFSVLSVSQGRLLPAETASWQVSQENNEATITWTNLNEEFTMPGYMTAKLQCVFYNSETKMGILSNTDTERSSGIFTIGLPASWNADDVHCWIYFASEKGEHSISTYAVKM